MLESIYPPIHILIIMQALLGFERNVTHLDGHIVTLKRNGTTQPGVYA
jgi:DnaJ-related protein SCJ1